MKLSKELRRKYYIILAMAFNFAGCSHNDNQFQRAVNQALEFEKADDYNKALVELNKAILLDSIQSFTFVLRGNVKSTLGNDRAAIEDFSKAIRLNDKNGAAFFSRAISYSLLDKDDSAVLNFDSAITTKLHGDVYFEETKNEFSTMEEQMDVQLFVIKYFRAKALYAVGRYEEALKDFKYSLNENYKVPECQFYIGVILISKGQSEGCDYLKRARHEGYQQAEEYLVRYCK